MTDRPETPSNRTGRHELLSYASMRERPPLGVASPPPVPKRPTAPSSRTQAVRAVVGVGSVVARLGRGRRSWVALWGFFLGAVCVGALGVAGALNGWVWPLIFLAGAVVVGVLVGRRPWLVVGMVVATGVLLSAPDGAVRYVGTLWLFVAAHVGAAAVLGFARRWVLGGTALLWVLGGLLPRTEREFWRAEVRAVLHACGDDREVRRQVVGFLAAVPATVVTGWRVRS